MAEIQPIKYSSELQKLVFPDNSFYKKSVQETGVADTVTAVERPVQKKIREAKEGEPKTLPLPVEVAEDGKDTYPVTQIYAEPLVITSQSELLTNYSKRQTKQQQQADEINTKVANKAAYNWLPTVQTNILKTTGDGRVSNVIGITGNRKAVTKDDMVALQNLLMRMNSTGNYIGLVTADFYSDLLKIAEFTDYEKTGNRTALAEGIVGRIVGIDIFVRSTDAYHIGAVYNNAATAVKKAAVSAETDRPGNLFWSPKAVCSAEGKLNTSVNPDRAEYLGGTLISSWTRFGAAHSREDERGVVALLEDNV